ncbi:uncharacterized protein [Coffea arabica]|uniref:Uncharacterized protein isoform X2 n=1 Tax=Coffea arabica TaxID=13443 RepID=A0ABM4W2I3_COFAR
MGFEGTIPSQLGNLSFLVSLDMSNNSFHGYLPTGMSHLRRLSFMALSNNNFAGEIPSWLGALDRLQYLSLSNNSFLGDLPANICNNLSNLKEVDMFSNQLSDEILSDLSNCSRLESLSLSYNQFSGSIPKELGRLKMPEVLHLAVNILEDWDNSTWLHTNQLRMLFSPSYSWWFSVGFGATARKSSRWRFWNKLPTKTYSQASLGAD